MRNVFDKEQVAHLWAHKAQDTARTSSQNFFFTGSTLYSYGSHHVVAFHLPACYGARLALFNADRVSMTTGRHHDATRYAARNVLELIDVPGLNENMVRRIDRHGCADVVAAMLGRMRNAIRDADTSRRVRPDTRASHIRVAAQWAEDARRLASVDVTRKDIAKEDRAAARRALASIPNFDGIETREQIAELAARVLRAESRELYASAVESWRRDAASVIALADAGMRYAYQYDNATNVPRRFDTVREHAARAGIRISGADKKLHADTLAALKVLEGQRDTLQRASLLSQWAADVEESQAPDISERALAYMARRLAETADALAALDSDAERAERAHVATDAMTRWKGMRAAEAPDKAARELESARSYLPQWIGDAERHARAAVRELDQWAPDHDMLADARALLADIERQREARDAEKVEQWRAGARVHLERGGSALLRLSADRKTIETSWGASVPADVAPMLWVLVRAARNGHERTWESGTGPRLGHYRLDAVRADGITAGCHEIGYSELERMAHALKVAP